MDEITGLSRSLVLVPAVLHLMTGTKTEAGENASVADLPKLPFETQAKVTDEEILAIARLNARVKAFAGREPVCRDRICSTFGYPYSTSFQRTLSDIDQAAKGRSACAALQPRAGLGMAKRFSGDGGMQAAKVMAALIAVGCASAPVVQAQTRSPRSYSKVEIDQKIDQIRRDLTAKIPTPEQIEALLGPIYSKTDVDQKLNQLNAAIPLQTVSRQDLEKALQQTVSQQDLDKALQQTVSRQDLNEAIARATDNAKAREKAIDDKLSWMPPWVAPLVSFLGIMISGGLAYCIASKAREQAKTLATAARADAEADAANMRTNAYVREWRSGQGRMHALVLHDLTCAHAITDPDALNRIADVGNWLDDLADDTLEGRLDQAKMNSGFQLMAEEFRNALAGRMEDDLVMRRNAWTRLAAWI
jgi:hypothetical protein